MKILGKIFRLFSLLVFITLASVGMGMPFFFQQRERYQNKKIQIEMVDKKDEEDALART